MRLDLKESKEMIEFCRNKGIKNVCLGDFVIEFFESKSAEPMDLSPLNLAKALQESMPPDSAMLFAATEDVEEKVIE